MNQENNTTSNSLLFGERVIRPVAIWPIDAKVYIIFLLFFTTVALFIQVELVSIIANFLEPLSFLWKSLMWALLLISIYSARHCGQEGDLVKIIVGILMISFCAGFVFSIENTGAEERFLKVFLLPMLSFPISANFHINNSRNLYFLGGVMFLIWFLGGPADVLHISSIEIFISEIALVLAFLFCLVASLVDIMASISADIREGREKYNLSGAYVFQLIAIFSAIGIQNISFL